MDRAQVKAAKKQFALQDKKVAQENKKYLKSKSEALKRKQATDKKLTQGFMKREVLTK